MFLDTGKGGCLFKLLPAPGPVRIGFDTVQVNVSESSKNDEVLPQAPHACSRIQ